MVAQSARILNYLKPPFSEFTSSEAAFILAFDKLEYLISLIHADFRISYERNTGNRVLLFAPPGLFAYRLGLGWPAALSGLVAQGAENVIKVMNDEISQQGGNWFPLSAGYFGGSTERVNDAVKYTKQYFSTAGIAAR